MIADTTLLGIGSLAFTTVVESLSSLLFAYGFLE